MEGVAEAEYGDIHIHLEYEGEGYQESYNPDDPSDRPLLRFRLFVHGDLARKLAEDHRDADYDPGDPAAWMDVPQGTYCTNIIATISIEEATALAEKMIKAVADAYARGETSLRRICERLSWMEATDDPAALLVEQY